jgi:DNA-binding response OmpR family regulator
VVSFQDVGGASGSVPRGPEPATIVVEDDEPVASMLSCLLEEHGSRCVTTGNAEEAWRLLPGMGATAAVIDIRLPGKDGWWLVHRIRSDAATCCLPIVIIAGMLDGAAESRAADLGCECLGKPFTFATLIEKLKGAEKLAAALDTVPVVVRPSGEPPAT